MHERLTIFAVIAALLTACNARPTFGTPVPNATQAPPNTNPPPTEQPASTFTAEPAATAQSSGAGLCANPLSPVVLGATWTYENTGAAVSPSSFTTTITSVRTDGFTVATRLDDSASVNQEWACKPEGLVALSLGAGQTALDLSMQGVQADITTSNATGVTLPANVQPGMTWPYGLDISGTLSQGDLSAKIDGTVSTAFRALGTESVTVPAGTFDAAKIQGTSTFKLSADYHGLSLPITSVITTTFWFAPGLGWVKSAESGDLAGTTVDSTTQLQSYHIP